MSNKRPLSDTNGVSRVAQAFKKTAMRLYLVEEEEIARGAKMRKSVAEVKSKPKRRVRGKEEDEP